MIDCLPDCHARDLGPVEHAKGCANAIKYSKVVRKEEGRLFTRWSGHVLVKEPEEDQTDTPFPTPTMQLSKMFMGAAMDLRAFTRARLIRKLDKLIEWHKREHQRDQLTEVIA